MKRFGNKLCSVALVVLLIIGSMILVSAEEKTDFENYLEYYYDITDYYQETVDGVLYTYLVNESSNAYIIHIRSNVTESQNGKVITLPEKLGGYPVTTIGIVDVGIEVFAYYNDGEDLSVLYPEFEDPEYDPGLEYVSKIIIPEGYEYIGRSALRTFSLFEWQFPKSLKELNGFCFETLYTDYDNQFTVLPEAKYNNHDSFINILFQPWGHSGFTVVTPSRDTGLSLQLFRKIGIQVYHQNYVSRLYVPYNLSYNDVRSFLIYNAHLDYYETKPTLSFTCAPDCEWLKVFEDYPEYNMNVTYIEPATHIAFDSDTVSVSVGEVVDLEAKTYPAEAVWTACDYVSSNPEVVKVDPYSGRITALAEGEATITATHVERGFVDTCTVKVENKPEHICSPAEKWSADETAHWLECTDPECGEITGYAEHSGGNATVNAKAVCEHCGTAYGDYAAASFSVEPVSDIAYCAREKREYRITVAENADKVQFIRDSGSTTTFVRSQAAEITNNGDGTETWILAVSLNKGKYTLATKYGKVWNKNGIEFEIAFDTPKCRSFTSEKVGNLTTFTAVTDPQVAKIQLITQSGNTLTYTQANSYIGEDGMRYWTVVRKITVPGTIGLRTKYGYTWTTTDFTIDV